MATRIQLPRPPVPMSRDEWYNDHKSVGAGIRGETIPKNIRNRYLSTNKCYKNHADVEEGIRGEAVLGNISNRYLSRNEWYNHASIGAGVRGEVTIGNISNRYMEDRQLFLRSYQFSRKQTLRERIKASVDKAKRLVWRRIRAAGRTRKVIWFRLRSAVVRRRRRLWRFLRRQIQSCSKDSELGKNYYWKYYFIYGSPYIRYNSTASGGYYNCFI